MNVPETVGDPAVDSVLADLAREDPDVAAAARAGFESLTAGAGLAAVTAHGLADLLWYQLPTKWLCELEERQQIAAALGTLFARLERPRYAAMCDSETTSTILMTYERDGREAGIKAYHAALAASGVRPPDIPGLLTWGSVMGLDEAAAYWSASIALERAIDEGRLRPGVSGWRGRARAITTWFLNSPHDDLTGSTWLQWLHTERLQRWISPRNTLRDRLAGKIVDELTNEPPVPDDAEQSLAPVRWLLDHAAEGAQLTQTGRLARAIVAEGCQRFGWLTSSDNPRSESDIVELRALRELAAHLGAVRRSGSRLLLSNVGKTLRFADTTELWYATMACLPGPDPAEAAAIEIALLLLLLEPPLGYQARLDRVAQVMAEQGWRTGRGEPVDAHQAGWLIGGLSRRMDLLNLVVDRHSFSPAPLSATGRAAGYAALRARALRPRTESFE